MIKTLSKHSNSLALVIEKPILELIGADAETPFDVSTDGQAKVSYSSKDRRESQTFNALDGLAQLVTHITDKGEQMVRYYEYDSNTARGMLQKEEGDNDCPGLLESPLSCTAWVKNWARRIQKLSEVDP